MPQRYDNFANVEKVVFDGEDFDRLCDAIDSVHAALEAENERLREQDHDGDWMKLPVDADGLPIHIGDVMVGEKVGGGYCGPFEVVGYVTSNGVIEPMDEHKLPRIQKYAHHQPDTWERIIEDAIDAVDDCWANDEHDKLVDALVARCKALAGDAE
jgi:hypothetical protein